CGALSADVTVLLQNAFDSGGAAVKTVMQDHKAETTDGESLKLRTRTPTVTVGIHGSDLLSHRSGRQRQTIKANTSFDTVCAPYTRTRALLIGGRWFDFRDVGLDIGSVFIDVGPPTHRKCYQPEPA
ncbi:hypothetical protein BaRGS_00027917, partial [Batillaria attramentaria]